MSLDAITFGIILLLFVVSGLIKYRQVQSADSYLFADRKCGLFGLTATLVMTELNTSTLLAFSGVGYAAGLRALFLPLVFLIGLLFYAFTVAKKYQEHNFFSVTELFQAKYGSNIARIASLFLLVAMIGFNATYVKTTTMIFAPIFPTLSEWQLSAYLIVLILVMTLRGGLVAIIRTDTISFFLICLIFPLFLFFSTQHGGNTPLPYFPELLPPRFIISLVVLTMFTYILAPWYSQKIFSARSSKIAVTATTLAAILVFLFYGIGVLATALMKANDLAISSPEQALPTLIMQLFPAGLRGIAYATLFMVSATTLAGVWSAMSAMVTAQLKLSYKPGLLFTLLFALLSYLCGNTFVDIILDKLILANIPVVALSFALLAGFYWKKASSFGALLSIFTGLAWGIFSYCYFGEEGIYTWYWALWGIPLIFLTGIFGSFLKPLRVSVNF